MMRRAMGYIWGIVLVVLLWWALSAALGTPALPTPFQTIPVVAQSLPTLLPALGDSAVKLLVGMLIGSIIGVPLGLFLGSSKTADVSLGPALYILYPLPKIVLLPVLFVILGIGWQTKTVLIAIAVLFQVTITMRDAAKDIDPDLYLSIQAYGASSMQLLRYVTLPATLPWFFSGLRLATGSAIAILFISESMAGSAGLGYYIMHSWSMLEYPHMFAGIVAMAILGIALYAIFDLMESRSSRWRTSRRR